MGKLTRLVDPETRIPKSFCFVEYRTAAGARRCLRLLNNFDIDGQQLLVKADSKVQAALDKWAEDNPTQAAAEYSSSCNATAAQNITTATADKAEPANSETATTVSDNTEATPNASASTEPATTDAAVSQPAAAHDSSTASSEKFPDVVQPRSGDEIALSKIDALLEERKKNPPAAPKAVESGPKLSSVIAAATAAAAAMRPMRQFQHQQQPAHANGSSLAAALLAGAAEHSDGDRRRSKCSITRSACALNAVEMGRLIVCILVSCRCYACFCRCRAQCESRGG